MCQLRHIIGFSKAQGVQGSFTLQKILAQLARGFFHHGSLPQTRRNTVSADAAPGHLLGKTRRARDQSRLGRAVNALAGIGIQRRRRGNENQRRSLPRIVAAVAKAARGQKRGVAVDAESLIGRLRRVQAHGQIPGLPGAEGHAPQFAVALAQILNPGGQTLEVGAQAAWFRVQALRRGAELAQSAQCRRVTPGDNDRGPRPVAEQAVARPMPELAPVTRMTSAAWNVFKP